MTWDLDKVLFIVYNYYSPTNYTIVMTTDYRDFQRRQRVSTFRSETLRELQSLQKQWRKQDFKYTKEQQERYDFLLKACRRDQVNKFWEDGNVWIGPSLSCSKPLDESKKEEDNND